MSPVKAEAFSVTVTVYLEENEADPDGYEVKMDAQVNVSEGFPPQEAMAASPDALRKAAADIERRIADSRYTLAIKDAVEVADT